ncbi:MAG: galactokinase [Candidatus Glassbacteria bacterium]|nr:galactokinase [Candidatus Glassbacteria bacterium]
MTDRDKLIARLGDRDSELLAQLDKHYNIDVTDRFLRVLEYHAERFPEDKQVIVLKAPGRVNVIGEHLDYNGLPVFPMAIDYDMLIALSPRDDRKVIAVNPEYDDREFEISPDIPKFDTGDWGNYIKAGVQGIVDHQGGVEKLKGFNGSFLGTVPVGSGLSSSSTLVVASAMAVLESSGLGMPPLELADLMARAEWYVGTQGGGMDHAASILSEKGKALRIGFFPLSARPVALPAGFTIVVANSMVVSAKTEVSRIRFNLLPAACQIACAMMVKTMGLEGEGIERIGDIFFKLGRVETLRGHERTFTRERYTRHDVAEFLDKPLEEVESTLYTARSGEPLPEPEDGLRIGARARHVISEAIRVEESVKVIEAGDGEAFGRRMNGSWISCRDDFEISHPSLELLVDFGREAGTSGSRLTGAGWGGCTVHLVADDKVDTVLAALKEKYYEDAIKEFPAAAERYAQRPQDALLALRPSAGARVLF